MAYFRANHGERSICSPSRESGNDELVVILMNYMFASQVSDEKVEMTMVTHDM